ncbi:MAG: hypothetical protein ACOX0I_02090 [Bacilli bacterium]|jgi:hypothetical protein
MIKTVQNNQELKKWISFPKQLYSPSSFYVPPIYKILFKELKQQIFELKDYVALFCLKDDLIKGRILYTFKESRRSQTLTCYFSYFDCFNEQEIADELFDYLKKECKKHNCKYIEGSYTPYDPDNRRGILVEGFEYPPMIFTSYNPPYYPTLLENIGFTKAYDTLALRANIPLNKPRMEKLANFVQRHLPALKLETLNPKEWKKQGQALYDIMKEASTNLNLSMAPSAKFVQDYIKKNRFFVKEDYVAIAYDKDKPIGFCAMLPDYNSVLKELDGKINIFKFLKAKKQIKACRGFLQYVIPAYQDKGVVIALYNLLSTNMLKNKNEHFEASTILEENIKSTNLVQSFEGSEIYKRYRIYHLEV